MSKDLTTRDFFQSHGVRLGLNWQAGQDGENRLLHNEKTDSGMPIAGYLNLVKPNQVQVLGPEEVKYLKQLGKNSHDDAISRLFNCNPAMIIFADITHSDSIAQDFITLANQTSTPLLYSNLSSNKLTELLQYHLRRLLSDSKILHGVFMEVMGIGILLTGPSGIGKSELALELISRGHRLIADDAPEFRRSGPDSIRGRSPALLKDFLEVRGLGVLNVRAMFGDNSIVETKRLRLIVHLESISTTTSDRKLWEIDRIGGTHRIQSILEVDIPKVHIPVAPGRNVAVIIEAAVRNHVLYLNGYSAADDFIKRQQKLIDGE
ncbi:MAG: HPr(Ser) kinase/phosphatase [Gammaproteobacteria bacterium]|nr:HPr(Ser) kinase/phosphatase [Gammaproteobacteria bacterium]MCW8988712.1 HPr(Ser) kinase/phosphatase [Gammaproteobacteria bacterium]MCW9030927.1 HPr(Ser) kinase/phosphatase [Gammaproteobacteria bacterium]